MKYNLEEIRKEKARRSLIGFTRFTFPVYKAEPAHMYIAGALEKVLSGEIDRLMIFCPPQHGKSQLASIHFVAYWFAKHPDLSVILTSYGASLSYSKSKQARAILESPEFSELFPDIKTDPSSRAVDNWSILGHRGELVAAGVGGPITGRGCFLGILDDPVENYQESMSIKARDRVYEWYRTTFRTRVRDGGRIVIIMTRWHADDLCGRLLEDQPDNWHVLRLPAISETQKERDLGAELLNQPMGQPDPLNRKPGKALCPIRFSLASLKELRNDVGQVAFQAQYQGVPRLPAGNRFKRHWFIIVDDIPLNYIALVRYWDKASSEAKNDYTVGVLMGLADGKYYVLDVVRGQWSTDKREQMIVKTAERDHAQYGRQVKVYHEQEPGSSGIDSAKMTTINLAGFPVFAIRSTGNKEIRAEPFAAMCEAGQVYIYNGDWRKEYIEELCLFPQGALDDQVDGSSGAFNKLPRKRKAKVISVNL